jgi:penicillin-binding protein 2
MRPRKSVNVGSLVGSPEDETSRPSLRLRVVGVVVLLLFGILVLRLWTLQVIDGKTYAAAVTANQVRVVSVAAPRGEIVDRNDTVLVSNLPEEEILLSHEESVQNPSIIGKVAALIGQTPAQVKASLKDNQYSPYEPVPVATNVPSSTVLSLELHQSEYPGVTVQTITQRQYPQGGTTAPHVLGYLGDITSKFLADNPHAGYTQASVVGESGIEAQYEQYLRGVDGRQALSVNASGDVVGTLSHKAPQLGDTVVLNIDTGLQEAVESDLASQIKIDRQTPDVQDHGLRPPAPNGAVIVMNPQDGQIYSMASFPTYDNNEFVGGISSANFQAIENSGAFNDDAIAGLYTPGSTFKLITATAALQAGLISPGTYYHDTGTYKVQNCTGGTCSFSDNPGDPTGDFNVSSALTVSSDSFFYNIGDLFADATSKYGQAPIQDAAAQYGEGEITGIDLPNEAQGRVDSQAERQKLHDNKNTAALAPYTTWYTGDNIEMAFGQGATFLTPIEQAVAYATFANGGTRYAPQVASEIVNPNSNKVVKQFAPDSTGKVVISPANYSAILQGLEGVIYNKNGTGYGAFRGFPANFVLAGKTGTASNQKGQEPNSWFVAFGPEPHPTYLVLAVIGQGGYGADAAAPLVRNIFDYLLANPVGGVKTPTASNPVSSVAPTTVPPVGTPTTTTTTTPTHSTATTTTTAPAATTTTAPVTTTTAASPTGG